MARRATRTNKTLAQDEPESEKMLGLKHLVEMINEGLKREREGENDPVFNTLAGVIVPVLLNDGAYRQQTMTTDVELTIVGARIGARQNIIFTLSPLDARPYKQAEFGESGNNPIFQVFPGAESYLCKAIGYPSESWSKAKSLLLGDFSRAKNAEVKAAKAAVESNYQGNPNWGLF